MAVICRARKGSWHEVSDESCRWLRKPGRCKSGEAGRSRPSSIPAGARTPGAPLVPRLQEMRAEASAWRACVAGGQGGARHASHHLHRGVLDGGGAVAVLGLQRLVGLPLALNREHGQLLQGTEGGGGGGGGGGRGRVSEGCEWCSEAGVEGVGRRAADGGDVGRHSQHRRASTRARCACALPHAQAHAGAQARGGKAVAAALASPL